MEHLIQRYRAVAVASVSDAVDALVGVRACMAPELRPIVNGTIVGRAATALLRPAPREVATREASLRDPVTMIDTSAAGDVGVIVLEDGHDVAGLGGLMAVAAHARGMAGIVCDGAVRDVTELRGLGMPVVARGASPTACVGRFVSAGLQVPVVCGGVRVRPGDLIVANEDGVVVVPAEHAEAVLEYAEDLDSREARMIPEIRTEKALRPVSARYHRG